MPSSDHLLNTNIRIRYEVDYNALILVSNFLLKGQRKKEGAAKR